MKKTFFTFASLALLPVAGLLTAAMAPVTATAAIAVTDDGSLKLFGDARLRFEYDNRAKQKNVDITGATEHRDRFRLRARIGALYAPDDTWSMGLRLRSESDALNSPHQTTGFFSNSVSGSGRNQDFGLDRVYIKLNVPVPGGQFSVWGGKNGFNLWQQTEVWWDDDLQPEGVAGTFKTTALPIGGTLTLTGSGFILSEGNFKGSAFGKNDGSIAFVQGVYQTRIFGSQLTMAGNYGKIFNTLDLSAAINNLADNTGGRTLQSSRYAGASVQIKGSGWRIGGDFIDSNSRSQDTAYVIQGRYQPGFLYGIGLRVYYYHVEGFSVPGDGIFTQDNWANPGIFGVSNFRGMRYQIDYRFNNHVSIDFRAYIARRLKTTIGALQANGTVTDALMNRRKHDRFQGNLNVKF